MKHVENETVSHVSTCMFQKKLVFTKNMDTKRIKLDRESSPFPLKKLFDEILEEVFTHLRPKEQLSCRQVCHLWNDLLCRDARLLKNSVGIHLEIDNEVQVNDQHPLIPILKQNPALKVRRVTLDAGLFMINNGATANLDKLIEYFNQFGDKGLVTEIKITYGQYQSLALFNIIFTMLDIFNKTKILRLTLDSMDPLANTHLIHFPQKWSEIRWDSVEQVHLTYFEWSSEMYQNYVNFCEKLPNLKIITGLEGYNEAFYQKFGKVIKYAYLNFDQINSLTTANTGIQLKGLYIHGDNEHNDAENCWNFLNNNQTELDDISLDIDDPWNLPGNGMKPFPAYNYDKVRLLKVHSPANDEQAHRLQQDLLMFKNIRKLYVFISNWGNCFFGHEIVSLPKLETVDYTTSRRENTITCLECFKTLIQTSKHVKKLSLVMPVTLNEIQFIADTIPDLENLKLTKLNPESEIPYKCWPKMEKLEDIFIPYKIDLTTDFVVAAFCESCPNLKRIRIFEADRLDDAILAKFVEKLKFLEKIQFDNQTFILKEDDGERKLVKK